MSRSKFEEAKEKCRKKHEPKEPSKAPPDVGQECLERCNDLLSIFDEMLLDYGINRDEFDLCEDLTVSCVNCDKRSNGSFSPNTSTLIIAPM